MFINLIQICNDVLEGFRLILLFMSVKYVSASPHQNGSTATAKLVNHNKQTNQT